ncbi:MAG: serine/threonine-protein kinase [Myxococcota bacterium]
MGVSSSGARAHSTADHVGMQVVHDEGSDVIRLGEWSTDDSVCLGRYRLREPLGIGGCGVVFEAWDHELQRRVAIKLVRLGKHSSREATGRLVREARSLASLEHANIVRVYDVGRYGSADFHSETNPALPPRGVYIVMELVDGVDLDRWLRARRRPWREILDVFLDAGRGLSAAHHAGRLHRDFKPANVLVGTDGRARVVDFGLARVLDEVPTTQVSGDEDEAIPKVAPLVLGVEAHGRLTGTGKIVGTPAYMAPEQFTRGASSQASDQYSFAVSLYEGLYGSRPFQGDRLSAIVDAKLRGPAALDPVGARHVPRWVHKALARALHPGDRSRYPDLDSLLDALSAKHRRRRSLGVAFVGLAAVSSAWALVPDPERCERAVWHGTEHERITRDRVEAAILATRVSYAPSVAETVDRQLEGYAAAWEGAHRRVCREGGEALDARMGCLQRAEAEASALVDVLAAADPAIVRHAVSAATKLPEPGQCLADASDEEPRWTPEVEAAYAKLARGQALQRAGKPSEGRPVAVAVLKAAERAGHQRLAIRATYLLGQLAVQDGDYDRAREHLQATFFATDHPGWERMRARAAMRLALLEGLARADLEAQHRWLRHAESALARVAEPGVLATIIHNHRADYHLERGEVAEADAQFRQALRSAVEVDADDVTRAVSYIGLSATTLASDDFDAALRNAQTAVTLLAGSLGTSHPNMLAARMGLYSAYRAKGDYAAAQAQNALGIEIVMNTQGEDHPDDPGLLMNDAVVSAMLGETAAALRQGERALELTRRRFGDEHPAVTDARFNLGYFYLDNGQPDAARHHLAVVLVSIERFFGEDGTRAASAHAALGRADEELGKLDVATEHYRRALEIHEARRGEESLEVARDLVNLARVWAQQGQAADAQQAAARALSLRRRQEVEPLLLAEAEFTLAIAMWAEPNRRDDATELAEDALARFEAEAGGERFATEVRAWLEGHPPATGE